MKGLSRQILQALLLAALAVLSLWGVVEYAVARHQGRQQLLADQSAMAERLAFNLDHPLWELDRADIERTLSYEAVAPAVLALLVYDEQDALYVGKLRAANGALVDLDPRDPATAARLDQAFADLSRKVLLKGRPIGRLQVYVSDAPLRASLRRQWLGWMLKVACLLVLLSAAAFWALRRAVLRPLSGLVAWVGAVQPGRPLPPSPPGLGQELQALLASFEALADRVAQDSAQLRDSEEWHRVLHQRSHFALLTLAPPHWRFTSGNAAAVQIFGAQDEADLLACEPWRLSPALQPDGKPSGEKAMEMIGTAMSQGSARFTWTHQRLNGDAFPATVLLNRMEIRGEPLLQATVLDESKMASLQAGLAQGLRNYEALYLSLPLPVFIFDLATRRFVDANPAAGLLLKMRREDIVGLPLTHFVPPDLREDFVARLKARDPKAPSHEQQRIQDNEGAPLDVEVHARTIDVGDRSLRLVMMNDVTGNLAAQAALHSNEARFRALVENTSDIILIYRPDGTVGYANPAVASAVLGYSHAELTGFGAFDLVHPEDLPLVLKAAEAAAARPQHRAQMELRLHDKAGNWHSFDARSVNLGDNPMVGGVLVQLRDITASREGQRQLLRLERLAAIGQTAAGLAHEVRNPLATILTRAEYLKMQLDPASAMQADLDSVLRQVERLKDLVNQVLESSRIEELALKDVATDQLMEGALRAARIRYGLAAEAIRVDRDMPAPAPHVLADPVQLERVLLNLILNAFQSMGTQGALTLSLSTEDGQALLSVADNGPGIPEGKLAKVFEPFFTTKQTGSGLGLWVCKNIVEQHRGRLAVESLKPQGCRFTVRLPLAPPAA